MRFDPIVWHQNYAAHYQVMIEQIFTRLDANKIDSVTLGGFRLPKDFYKTMRRLFPEHWLFSAGLTENQGMVSYTPEIEHEVFAELQQQTLRFINSDRLYSYPAYQSQNTELANS